MRRQTRKVEAAELLKTLEQGPAWDLIEGPAGAKYLDLYRLWASAWVIPLVKRLVPELRRKEEGK